MYKVYKLKKGNISFKEKMEFNSLFKEIIWKFSMIRRGYQIERIK